MSLRSQKVEMRFINLIFQHLEKNALHNHIFYVSFLSRAQILEQEINLSGKC